jgi:hypothetical protein
MQIKENIKRARIDVGLSTSAPYSSYWLSTYNDMVVLGFEPNPYNIDRLMDGDDWVKDNYQMVHNEKLVKLNNEVHADIEAKGNQFIPFEVAVDNVDEETKKTFYCTSKLNTGCSSLYKPIEERLNGVTLESEIEVSAISLSSVLKDFPWEQIPYIEFLKVDTQANDLNVIKSAGEYLKKICFVQAEYFTNGSYEGEKMHHECLIELNQYMEANNFKCYHYSSTDASFVNNDLIGYIIENGIKNDGIEHINGYNFI